MRLIMMIMFLTAASICPWGLRGHRVTARIAENHLNDKARAGVKTLLADESLARVANEADHLRSDSRYACAAPFHYASVDDGETYKSSPKNPKGDIITALVYFEEVLRRGNVPRAEKQAALKWLIHLVGDLHQPLHIGRTADRGGNSTEVLWFGKKSNLHKVWDSEMINDQDLSYTEFADFLDKGSESTVAALQTGSYVDWADEAPVVRADLYTCQGKDGCCKNGAQKCRDDAVGFGSDVNFVPRLDYAYVEKQRPLMERQLYRGGVRLAGILNSVFSLTPSPSEKLSREIENRRKGLPDAIRDCIEAAGGR
jgi:hypothetical protein